MSFAEPTGCGSIPHLIEIDGEVCEKRGQIFVVVVVVLFVFFSSPTTVTFNERRSN